MGATEMPEMFSEGYVESTLRWHLYRRWRRRQDPHRVGERMFYDVALRAPKGSTFLDLGANVGLVTGAALSLGLKVVAFEPDPHALAALTNRSEGTRMSRSSPKQSAPGQGPQAFTAIATRTKGKPRRRR